MEKAYQTNRSSVRIRPDGPDLFHLPTRDGSLILRRRDDNDMPDEQPDTPTPDTPPPSPTLLLPSVAMQFTLDDQTYALVEPALLSALREQFGSSSDVRAHSEGQVRKIAIWPEAVTEENTEARAAGLAAVQIDVPPDSNLGLFITAGYIRRQALAIYATLPRRLDSDGNPDPDGRIRITGLRLDFVAPDRIRTIISGWIDAWPDNPSFELRIDDRLRISADGVRVEAESSEHFEADTSVLGIIGAMMAVIAGTIASSFLPPAGIVVGAALGAAGGGIGLAVALELWPIRPGLGGAGANAARLLPLEVMTGLGLKLVFDYQRVVVSTAGVYCSALLVPTPREPFLRLKAPNLTVLRPNQSTVGVEVGAILYDLRPRTDPTRPRFDLIWSGGALESLSRRGSVITATLSVRPDRADRRHVIGLRVIDADDLTASASAELEIHFIDEDGPAICRQRPWLPVCQPG